MRVLVASSFHISSTRDVWLKTVKGLNANGVEAVPFDLAGRLALFGFLEEKTKRSQIALPRDWSATTLAYEVLLGAAVYHDCEWVLITSPQYMPNEIPQMMRKVGIKTAAMMTECPYEDTIHTPVTSAAFDVTFINDLHSLGMFSSFCPRVEYIPHSYDPDMHYPGDDQRDDNIIFIGTGYSTRVKFLREVQWPARLDLYGWWPKEWLRYDAPLRKALRRSTSFTSKVDPKAKTLGATMTSVTGPEETAALYRTAAASFSIHRAMRYVGTTEEIMDGEAYSLGPRNWELAACRTFQISDYRPELVDVFGDSVPLYETPREFGDIMKRAFDDPDWREHLAYQQWEKAQPFSCINTMKTAAQVLAAA